MLENQLDSNSQPNLDLQRKKKPEYKKSYLVDKERSKPTIDDYLADEGYELARGEIIKVDEINHKYEHKKFSEDLDQKDVDDILKLKTEFEKIVFEFRRRNFSGQTPPKRYSKIHISR